VAGFKYSNGTDSTAPLPGLYRGTFSLTETGDTYMDMHGFGKGFVFLNGHNLGKYWYIGPQQTLYVPASWLNKGQNELVVFDELKGGHTAIKTLDHPVLNEVVKN
jgi:beta-galactosidase